MSPLSRFLYLAVFAAALSAQAYVKVDINFQPDTSAVPMGYKKDVGAAWSDAAGKGWVTEASLASATHVPLDQTALVRDRARSGIDARQNTFVHMQPTGAAAGAYEYAVPNGTYTVEAGVGDKSPYNSTHSINVEGVSLISNFVGTSTKEFMVAKTTVTVSDGRLTIDALGGLNTKLDYLRIASSDAPADIKAIDVKINFQNSTPTAPSGYLKDYGQKYGSRTSTGQGSGWSYGWVDANSLSSTTHTALDLSTQGVDRAAPSDRRLATFMQMQNTATPGAWEIALPNNYYTVTVGVGDNTVTSGDYHRVWAEGSSTMTAFKPVSGNRFFAGSRVIKVSDGKLTLAPLSGTSKGTRTKIDYVAIKTSLNTSGRPSVSLVTPANNATGVNRDAAITCEVKLPNGAINDHTINSNTVQLFKSNDNTKIAANVNTSGGGDVIVVQPVALLSANTGYRVEVGEGVQDVSGAPFLPFTAAFVTGTATGESKTAQVFDKVALGAGTTGQKFTSVTVGPDHKLYVATVTGQILRFPINGDGTVGAAQTINTVRAAEGNTDRVIIGLTFDPTATASNLVLWVSNNAPSLDDAPDWSGKLSKLYGADLEFIQDWVIHFPRSKKDHMTSSIAFHDGFMYLTQASMSAMGAPDNAWGNRSEHLMNAAVLKVDYNAITPPYDIQTEDGGTYNPYAADAKVTLYATGVRNSYDLVWHSNGNLYAITNSSAANGNVPATPAAPVHCLDKPDYTGPAVTGITAVDHAQPDYLYKIVEGGYYGHPNPLRCEWVLNGGNPTSGVDKEEEHQYPVGTLPDPNWRGPHYVIGLHYSPDGALEYQSSTFGGALKGKLMIVRYSSGDNILVLTPVSGGMVNPLVLNTGTATFTDPLDIAEDAANGNLYVTEHAGMKVSLLRPH
jgi:hypothetical protein